MKKYLKLFVIAGLVSLASCDDRLDQDPIGNLTDGQFDDAPTLTGIENQTRAAYDLLSNRLNILAQWNWNGGLVFQNDYVLQDVASDDAQKKWENDGDQPWIDELNTFTFTSTNGGPNGLWKYNYEGIKRCNTVLKHLDNPDIETITGMSTEKKNQLMAECLYLRSYYYFALVTNFGNVPLILKPVTSIEEAYAVAVREDQSKVWEQIKSDLNKAITLLPNSKYSSETEKWRVSKAAAIALLAKSELYNKNWSAVPALVDQVAGLGYALNSNYFDAFNVSKEFAENEDIFVFDHQTNASPRRGNGMCAPLGWGFYAPTANFLAEFEANDPRLFYTVNVTDRNINKMLGTTDGTNKGNDDAPSNKIYIRFADVLLWKAEALLETGDYSGAVNIINQVRARARNSAAANGTVPPAGTLADHPASTDPAQIKQWLIHERRVELGFENQRLLDLKRWGIAKEVLNAQGINFKDKHILYPIPQSEIDASAGTLTQNPGY